MADNASRVKPRAYRRTTAAGRPARALQRLALLGFGLSAGCGGSAAPVGPEAGAPGSAETTVLPDSELSRPWVFLDRVGADLPVDALVRTPAGFVAVTHAPGVGDGKTNPARNNLAAVSADGLTWEQYLLGDSVHARALAFGEGVIVAVGQRWGAGTRGSILNSRDGKTWQEVPAPDVGLMAVRFLQGQFWAFGEQGAFFTSKDGRTWADQSRPASVQLNDLAFGAGHYVVVGNVSWLSSTDGHTWTEERSICPDIARCPGVLSPGGAAPGALALFSVMFGRDTFVTDGGVGGWTSTDGLTWTETPDALGSSLFYRGRFIGRADGRGAVVVSDDGRVWRDRTTFTTTDRNGLGCLDHDCLVYRDGILLIPKATDPAIVARPPVLELDGSRSGQSVSAVLDQKMVIYLHTIGPGQYGEPQLSSAAVRLLSAGFSAGPPDPGGPAQIFELVAASIGRAELLIPHTGASPPFRLVIDVAGP
jgi:hypothetical protein